MAKAVQMLDSEMISQLDISALARQGNPSEELNLQVQKSGKRRACVSSSGSGVSHILELDMDGYGGKAQTPSQPGVQCSLIVVQLVPGDLL